MSDDVVGPTSAGGRRWRARSVALLCGLAHTAAADPIEVEVRGDRVAVPPKEPSVAGSVIPEERLRAPGLQASDVLRTQPGVAVLETGAFGAPSTASLRGATAAQTPIYLAGIRLNDDVGGTADLSTVPLWLLHRVEIYRSHAPLAGDQLGIGGAIFFEPRRPKTTGGGAGAMAGSLGARGIWGRSEIGDGDASALVATRLDTARNDYPYENDHGTRFDPSYSRTQVRANADVTTLDAWALGSARLGNGRVDVVANDIEREQGLPAFSIFQTNRTRVGFARRLAGITTHVPCASRGCELTTTTAAVFSHARYEDPLHEIDLGTDRLDVDGVRVEEGVLVRWEISDRISVTPAARASIERLVVENAGNGSSHAERVFSRAAAQAEWTALDALTLRALGSVECHGTFLRGVPPFRSPGDAYALVHDADACSEVATAGRLGAELELGAASLLVNAGRYERVPTLTELYGLSGPVRGNTALRPETGISLEAGVRATGSKDGPLRRLAVDVFGFVRASRDLISFQRASSTYVRPYNLGSARVAGLEILAHWRPVEFARLQIAATLRDARNTAPDRPANDILPYQPKLIVVPRVEARARLHSLPVDTGKLAISYFYSASSYVDPAGLVATPPQGSLEVEAELGTADGRVALRARVANVLDQTRSDLLGYPLPGRAAYLALEAQW